MIGEHLEKSALNRLANEMKNGNQKAAATVYLKLVEKVFGFCISRVGSKTVAEDLTQDIFLKLVNRIGMYDAKKGDFVVWFWQMARNTVIDYYRREKTLSFSDLENESEIENIAHGNPGVEFDRKLEREEIEKLLRSLDEEEQELFRLRFVVELSYKEISEILDKSEGALRVAVNRLKKKMQNTKK